MGHSAGGNQPDCRKDKSVKVLIVGGGGREHAIAASVKKSKRVEKIYCAPGNAGIGLIAECVPIGAMEFDRLVSFAIEKEIDLTIVGMDDPLVGGLVDEMEQAGIRTFGPRKNAAILEGSKAFSKDLMKKYGISTAKYELFTDADAACAYIDSQGAPIVVKADGLALGKGVIVAQTVEEAKAAVRSMIEDKAFGQSGARVVIEEFMEGPEVSVLSFTDGETVIPMVSSMDHKCALDGDKGPNTGGMGAYSPAPVVTPEIHAKVMREIIEPTIRCMAADGIPFTGFLYAGLMISKAADGTPTVKTLEFNCRMGDPETQPIMSRITGDFAKVLKAACDGKLNEAELTWDNRSALGVVIAARGYPEHPEKGAVITDLPCNDADHHLFHAGTAKNAKGELVVAGGRVLCAVGLGDTLQKAHDAAYEAAREVRFDGMQMRSDIGFRALGK